MGILLNGLRFTLTCSDLEALAADMNIKLALAIEVWIRPREILWHLHQLSFKNLLLRWKRTGKQPIHMAGFLAFSKEIPFAHFVMAVSALAFLSYDIVLSFSQEVKVIYPQFFLSC